MPAPVALSRLPVGSSASTTAGPADQRPGDGHPLALAAGQPPGPVPGAVRQADPVQRGRGGPPPVRRRYPPVEQPGGDVVPRGEVVQQEELLEDHAQPVRAQAGRAAGRTAPRSGGRRSAPSRDGRPVQPGGEVEQRGLAGAGRSDHGDQLSTVDGQADAARPTSTGGFARVRPSAPGRSSRTRGRHDAGTCTSSPAVRSPVTSTVPVTRRTGPAAPRRTPPSASRTWYPPPGRASSATTGTSSTSCLLARGERTPAGAWSRSRAPRLAA